MVVKNNNSVVAGPSPNNVFAQYKSTFSSQSGSTKTPIRLRKNAPTRSSSYRSARSARSARTEERVDVEAYNPFGDEREDNEDSRSLFSEENSRDLWPSSMAVSTAQEEDDFAPETGPTGTPRRKRTGSTPFKPPRPSEGDDDGFTDGFRVSYSSSTPQRTAKSSVTSNFTNNQSHPFDEFRASSSTTTTPIRASKPSVLAKYKPSGGETNDGFRASHSSPTTPRRFSHSSASSSKNGTNEADPSNGFRSSFSSAFTPQRGARLSIGSTHTTQTANDNGSVVTSASQRSIKSSVSNKYTTNFGQAPEKSNAPKLITTPLRSKKSSVSNRYLSAVASKVQDDLNTNMPQVSAKVDMPAKVEVQSKVEEPEKVEMTSKNEPEKVRAAPPRRSSSFSSASAAKMWVPKDQPKKTFSPYKKNSTPKVEDDNVEKMAGAKMWVPPTEQPKKTFSPYKKNSTPKVEDDNVEKMAEAKMWLPPKEQPKMTFSSYEKNPTPKVEDDNVEKMVEAKVAVEMAKMKIQFDEEVQRIEERMEQKYRERIEALEGKFDKMNKVVGKMISKRKSMDSADMDRLEV